MIGRREVFFLGRKFGLTETAHGPVWVDVAEISNVRVTVAGAGPVVTGPFAPIGGQTIAVRFEDEAIIDTLPLRGSGKREIVRQYTAPPRGRAALLASTCMQ